MIFRQQNHPLQRGGLFQPAHARAAAGVLGVCGGGGSPCGGETVRHRLLFEVAEEASIEGITVSAMARRVTH